MVQVKPAFETFARIKVVGIGGAGGNALARMIEARIHGVEFIAVNTDAQALHASAASIKIHIGKSLTRGLGAGMNPEVGRQAAHDTKEEISAALKGAAMVFVTAGLGGGTGTGAAPVVAELAREAGALTLAVVTKPFTFEGLARMKIADAGWNNLRERVDSLITIPNDRILSIIDRKTPLLESFGIVDEVTGINKPHFIHRTFAEYFVAQFILEQLEDFNSEVKKYFLIKILKDTEFQVVRSFLNGKMKLIQIEKEILKDYGKTMKELWDETKETFIIATAEEGNIGKILFRED